MVDFCICKACDATVGAPKEWIRTFQPEEKIGYVLKYTVKSDKQNRILVLLAVPSLSHPLTS